MGLSSPTQTDNRAITPGPPEPGLRFGSRLFLSPGCTTAPGRTPRGIFGLPARRGHRRSLHRSRHRRHGKPEPDRVNALGGVA